MRQVFELLKTSGGKSTGFLIREALILVLISIIVSLYFAGDKQTAKFITMTLISFLFVIYLSLNERVNDKEHYFDLFFLFVSISAIMLDVTIVSMLNLAISLPHVLSFILLGSLFLNNDIKYLHEEHLPIVIIVTLLLFSFAGILTSVLKSASLYPAINACVIPLVIFALCYRLVSDAVKARKMIIASNMAIVSFILITLIGFLTGNATVIARGRMTGVQFSVDVKMGAFDYFLFPTMIGTLISMMIPSSIFLLMGRATKFQKYLFGGLVCLYLTLMVLIQSRGASIAALVGSIIIVGYLFVIVKKHSMLKVLLLFFTAGCLTYVSYFALESFISIETMSRIEKLREEGVEELNLQDRTNQFYDALQFNGVLGIGFDKMWKLYETDESIVYAWLLNGTGLLGFISFVIWIVYMFLNYLKSIITNSSNYLDYQILGMTTLITGLLSSIADNYLFVQPIYTIPFCVILGTTMKLQSLDKYNNAEI